MMYYVIIVLCTTRSAGEASEVRPEDGDDRYINSVDLSSEFASSEC